MNLDGSFGKLLAERIGKMPGHDSTSTCLDYDNKTISCDQIGDLNLTNSGKKLKRSGKLLNAKSKEVINTTQSF